MKRFLPLVIIIAVLVAAVATTWMVLRSRNNPTNSPADLSAKDTPGAQPPHIRGNPNAPVTLEEFADFECPSCGTYYSELKKIEADYGDKLRVIFREFPLYPTPHRHALIAAQAAEAAGLQARFWEMHDKLYENQKPWSDANDVLPIFIQFAKDIGIDPDRFARDLNGEVVAARITHDGIRAHALGVTGTPTFFVNGKPPDNFSPDGLRATIDAALRGK